MTVTQSFKPNSLSNEEKLRHDQSLGGNTAGSLAKPVFISYPVGKKELARQLNLL